MPLSRLENFLKNAEGNILYVNPSDFDATDSIENRGNSQTRPFKTIQRALIEAARFSYQVGKNMACVIRSMSVYLPVFIIGACNISAGMITALLNFIPKVNSLPQVT